MYRFTNLCPNGMMYVVQPGDTVRSLAYRFKVYDSSLLDANPFIQDPNRLYVGQILCIPIRKCPLNSFAYLVKPEDTIYKLAELFSISIQEILSFNPSLNPNNLPIGQSICIPEALY